MVNKGTAPQDQPIYPKPGKQHLRGAFQGNGMVGRIAILGPYGRPTNPVIEMIDNEGIQYELLVDPGIFDLSVLEHVSALVIDLTEAQGIDQVADTVAEEMKKTPTIAILSEEHVAYGLETAPADDILVYPWRIGELGLRLRRLAERRQRTRNDSEGVIRGGSLTIDINRYDVFVGDRQVLLTFKEYELLKLLASNPGRVFGREALLEQVWGYEYFGGTRTVDVHIRRLRSKIEDASHTFIDTVWNVGYRFRA